ncbi:MAG: c-type cytochrome [Candidatus Binataceae bacterium]
MNAAGPSCRFANGGAGKARQAGARVGVALAFIAALGGLNQAADAAACGAAASRASSNGPVNAASAHARIVVTPLLRAEAKKLYASRCAVCHGARGQGDGPGAANLDPKPPNFGNLAWQKSVSDEKISRAIVFGGPAVGLTMQMAPNPDLEDRPAVVAAFVEHIRKLGGKSR